MGFAFKKDTGDVRETPGVKVCELLMEDGAICNIFDPKVERNDAIWEMEQHSIKVQDKLFVFSDTVEEAVKDAHCLVILTEWDVFKTYYFSKFYDMMQKPAFVFDGRNLLDHSALRKIGFEVHAVGKPVIKTSETVNTYVGA